jgi:hypothetical protein
LATPFFFVNLCYNTKTLPFQETARIPSSSQVYESFFLLERSAVVDHSRWEHRPHLELPLMMGQQFARYVEECLHRLDLGEGVQEILADYPEYAERLKPLLLVAMTSRAVPTPIVRQTTRRQGKNRLLADMAQWDQAGFFRENPEVPLASRLFGQISDALRTRGITRIAPTIRILAATAVLVFTGSFLTLNATAASPTSLWSFLSGSLQEVVQIFDGIQQGEGHQALQNLHIFGGGDLHWVNKTATKVVFLLDHDDQEAAAQLSGQQNQEQNQKQNQGSVSNPAAGDPIDAGSTPGGQEGSDDSGGYCQDNCVDEGQEPDVDKEKKDKEEKDKEEKDKDKEEKDKEVKDKLDKIKDKVNDNQDGGDQGED